jgi:asparagine synthase (glutamine-hydrolysing)
LINQLIAYCASQVTDEQLAGAIAEFHPPITKEAYFYRSVFNKHYPQVSAAQTVEVDSKMARKSRSKRKSK